MAKPIRIEFISDIVCPWCVIGLKGLEQALDRLGDLVEAEIRFQPFELNPHLPAEGQDIAEHMAGKYGSTPEQLAAGRETVRARAAEVGFTISGADHRRIYNTFDAHRLLHWAGLHGRQEALTHALFEAYFARGLNPADHDVLADCAAAAGLDRADAIETLSSGAYAENVRAAERFWQGQGITSVPATIVERRWIISGGQPPETFEQLLRGIAAEL